ncbi:hypothetical protein M2454_001292 [Aequitasia blattaphilus]|uniref:YopX protein domain-containing protein n=1 Tax=Aequitasia blattaphilus TaxID=2949332 RepID=A0ABT1E7G0_9FIRM|nr:hypothetical protein [Aequitasia blattaphilus]MCP1101760.1 hypothetical protein [Aequitasia blattaphilus]MCR8614400.1 hypothetical protein [Aequitasia blattaphilus]
MFEGQPVDLRMTEMILEEGFFDDTTYHGEVYSYDEKKEVMYIEVKEVLPLFSLDAVYECSVVNDEGQIQVCEGEIEERFWSKDKNFILFLVQKGFYKNC